MTKNKTRIIVVGGRADGHGNVVCEVARTCPDVELAGFLDDAPTQKVLGGAPWLGPSRSWNDHVREGVAFHIAIGHNLTRRKIALEILAAGGRLGSVVSPDARIASSAQIGEGTLVAPGAVLAPGARVGSNCIVNHGAIVEHDGVIADHVNLSTAFASGGRVKIEEGVFAGVGVVLIPDVRVGRWSYLGAGAVVVEDAAPGGLYVGVPVRRVRDVGASDRPTDSA